jgi:hypothetical protein
MNRSHSFILGRNFLALGAAMLLALGMSVTMRAQSTTSGAMTVIVEDPQQAVIPDAAVSVQNEGTGQKLDDATNDVGACSFNALQPGVYDVTVTVTNFAMFTQTGVTVEVGRTSTVHVDLKVAAGSTTVNVSGEPPQVNTSDQAVANNVGAVDLANLPTNGRRWSSFALLVPGVTPDPDGYQDLSFRGISGYANNNTVDGGNNNQFFFAEERGRTRISYTLSQDSVDDFQVNTSDYSPQYGRSAGGVINTVTKSGTNQFHGDLFYYYKNNAIGATNPFTVESEFVGGVATNVPIKPPFQRQQFGGSIGGPIWKNKLFFFYTEDWQLQNFPIVAVPSNPNFLDAITLPAAYVCPTAANSPFVTASTTETQADALYCRLGLGATPTTTQLATAQGYVNSALSFLANLTGVVPRQGNQNIEFPKLDWHISPKSVATFSYNRMRWASPAGIQTNPTVSDGIDSIGNDYVHDDMGIARLNTAFSSTVTNEAMFIVSKDYEFEFAQPPTNGEPTTGLGGLPPEILISPSSNAGTTDAGSLEIGTPSFLNRYQYPLEYSYQGADTVSIVKGTHVIRFGLDIVDIDDTEKYLSNIEGTYSYSSNAYPMADFITDYTNWTTPSAHIPGCEVTSAVTVADPTGAVPCYHSYSQGAGPLAFSFATPTVGLFLQDTWRIRPRLTVNYGLRWDYELFPAPQAVNANVPQTSSFPNDKTDFGPRVGVAWDVFGDGKTSFRAGWGMYYGQISGGTIEDAIALTALSTSQSSLTCTNTTSTPTGAGTCKAPSPTEPYFPATLPTFSGSGSSVDFFVAHDKLP